LYSIQVSFGVVQQEQSQQTYYRNFLDSFKSEQTKQKYILEFNNYLKYLGVQNPNSLITDELLDSQPMIRQVEDQIIHYLNHLKRLNLSFGTINVRLYSILKFYTSNRVNLHRQYITQYKPPQKRTRKDSAYTHQQIQRILDSTTSERDRAIILLMASTGMRIGALSGLRLGSISNVYPPGFQENHIYKIIVYEGEREEYYTFTTFECVNAIDSYLYYRKRFGEELTPPSPLFRNHINTNLTSIINKPKLLNTTGLNTVIGRILIRSGLRTRTKKEDKHLHDNMMSHGMRKFKETQMIEANVEYNTRQFLVGHRSSVGIDASYDRTPESVRLREFTKAIDLLTISPENRLRKQVAEREYSIQYKLIKTNKLKK
jgi:integrase